MRPQRGSLQQPRGMVGEFLREAIDVEAAHAGDVLAQVLAAVRAGRANTANEGSVTAPHGRLARAVTPTPTATTSHEASAPTRQREQPLGEGHATEAPYVDVVQPDITDA